MSDPLHQLLAVQEQDTLVDQLRHRRQHHPLREELGHLRRQLDAAQARRAEAEERHELIAGRQGKLESELAGHTSRLAVIDSRLYSGEVSAARDLQAMATEADSLRARVADLEEQILMAMEEAEPAQADLAQVVETVEALSSQARQLGAELEAAEEEIRAEEATHEGRRAQLAGDVPPDLMARYERLRAHLGGVAVAVLVNGSCGGCHLALPPTELEQIRRAPPDAVVTCEQCGRLLVRP